MNPNTETTLPDTPARNPLACDIPQIGINFHQYHTNLYYRYICYWHHNGNDRHVYELTVRPRIIDHQEHWAATAQIDGRDVLALIGESKWHVTHSGMAAFRAYLWRSHRNSIRTWRNAKKGGAE